MRRFLVAGNWKMNTDRAGAVALASALAADLPTGAVPVDVLVCPPFPYLIPVGEAVGNSGVQLGAQNVYFEAPGAFTGEVACEMLRDVGCGWVILGHSERRHVLGETDEVIHRKVKAALAGGLQVILCVGELLSERESGQTEAVLDRQMAGGLGDLPGEQLPNVVIAYEPVWAIGTGKVATDEQAQSAHAHLRNWVAQRYTREIGEHLRILYGGSVKPENAKALLAQPDVDGALVGGASLKAEQFLPIVRSAAELSAH